MRHNPRKKRSEEYVLRKPGRSPSRCVLAMESLEVRAMMATLPYGADVRDTGEFFLGRIAVTPVLLESTGQVDASTENWNPSHINDVLANLNQGLNWWNDLLDTKSTVHNLDFVVDETYALNPSPTQYEPINRVSNDFALWGAEFLNRVGFNQFNSLDDNMRAFNHSQRLKYDADWAFTVFVVNSQVEQDGTFATGGSFSRAFAFAGGLFFVTPSTRPASTYAHETGHMFWARDEYSGGGNYFQQRGYYNTQNLNAVDLNPTPNFQQATSIMSAGSILQDAYQLKVSPASTLAMVGWQDSDSDGIFDVLDVPLSLDGVGRYEPTSGAYRFRGVAKTQTLPNLNSSGLQSDITLNRISRIEYRINGAAWQTITQPNQYVTNLDLTISVPSNLTGKIEIRAIDETTQITSNVYEGVLGAASDATNIVGIQGFVWSDADQDQAWDSDERTQNGWTVRLVDSVGQPITTQTSVEPDQFGTGEISNTYPGVRLTALGNDTDGTVGIFVDGNATTGTQVFRPFSNSLQDYSQVWRGSEQQLRLDFTNPTTFVSVDVIGAGSKSFGRLELYSSTGVLLSRATSDALSNGQSQKLSLGRDRADVAYAIIRAQNTTTIKIDNIRFGAASSTTTDQYGRYRFQHLVPGNYRVEIVDRANFTVSTSDVVSVTLGNDQNVDQVNFGAHFDGSSWHNYNNAFDTNDDLFVSPIDALLIINQLNLVGSRSLPGSGQPTSPFIDVNNDQLMSPLDVLLVINYLNLQSASGEGEAQGDGFSGGDGESGLLTSEGEQAEEPRGGSSGVDAIYAEWGRYQQAVGPSTTSQSFVERLQLPTWSMPLPCNCAYCASLGGVD